MLIRTGFITNSSSSAFLIWSQSGKITVTDLDKINWSQATRRAAKRCDLQIPSERVAEQLNRWKVNITEDMIDDLIEHVQKEFLDKPESPDSDEFFTPSSRLFKDMEHQLRVFRKVKRLLHLKGYTISIYHCEDLAGIIEPDPSKITPHMVDRSEVGFIMQSLASWEELGRFAESSGFGIDKLQFYLDRADLFRWDEWKEHIARFRKDPDYIGPGINILHKVNESPNQKSVDEPQNLDQDSY